MSDYVAPACGLDAFNCPHCGAYAHQEFNDAGFGVHVWDKVNFVEVPLHSYSRCQRCGEYALWVGDALVYPAMSPAPLPNAHMPPCVREDYLEARDLAARSPRAAAALLRLALQRLMTHVGRGGKNLNEDIGELVKQGLPESVQRALDVVRVIGNNAVHPGEMDLKDDRETAAALFELLNLIVEQTIGRDTKIAGLWNMLPEGAKDSIAKRDSS